MLLGEPSPSAWRLRHLTPSPKVGGESNNASAFLQSRSETPWSPPPRGGVARRSRDGEEPACSKKTDIGNEQRKDGSNRIFFIHTRSFLSTAFYTEKSVCHFAVAILPLGGRLPKYILKKDTIEHSQSPHPGWYIPCEIQTAVPFARWASTSLRMTQGERAGLVVPDRWRE